MNTIIERLEKDGKTIADVVKRSYQRFLEGDARARRYLLGIVHGLEATGYIGWDEYNAATDELLEL